jgi:D-galactose 1-dehydrogenase
MKPTGIGIVGVGKIARDQHIPTIRSSPRYDLIAIADPQASVEGIQGYPSLEEMLDAHPDIEAVVLCQPPQARFECAREALLRGRHVFLEKPPAATVSEMEILRALAQARGLTLFTGWHSQLASAVEAARVQLSEWAVQRVRIEWKEDVRRWHPGQTWIWQTGGFGVFDPGINALSILTFILPEKVGLMSAKLSIPENRQAPIAASLQMNTVSGAPVEAVFDWRITGEQIWTIEVEAEEGRLTLSEGGNRLSINENNVLVAPEGEYAGLYRTFSDLIEAGTSHVDIEPLQLVADAFLQGSILTTEPFLD